MEAIIVAIITIVPACITAVVSFRRQGTVNTSTVDMSNKDMDEIKASMNELFLEQTQLWNEKTNKLEAEIKELDQSQKNITKALTQALSLFGEILASESSLSIPMREKISHMIHNLQDLIK